jgi:hypothetical protein
MLEPFNMCAHDVAHERRNMFERMPEVATIFGLAFCHGLAVFLENKHRMSAKAYEWSWESYTSSKAGLKAASRLRREVEHMLTSTRGRQ